jgi:hypothetical protein
MTTRHFAAILAADVVRSMPAASEFLLRGHRARVRVALGRWTRCPSEECRLTRHVLDHGESEMSTLKSSRVVETLAIGALGGIAGGCAEIAWIALYGAATGTPTDPVARGIVDSVIPALTTSSWAASLGIVIHLVLAIALGVVLALALRLVARRTGAGRLEFPLVMLALAAVWAVNFFVALPHLNPEFVRLLPYGVTLLSKLLFGLSAAAVFRANRMREARIPVG